LRTDELSTHLLRTAASSCADETKSEQGDLESKNENENENDNENDIEVNEEASSDPKILITTHDLKISSKTYKLCRELSRILPNADYFYRKNVRLSKMIPEAIKRNYSAIIVINEDHKKPSKLSLAHFIV
jgi:ribosome production factor 1